MATSTFAPPAASRFGFSPAFRRLMWKEYRSLRAIWVVLAFISVIWRIMLSILNPPFEAQLSMFSIPAMFAMGAGVLLFAWESEERTLNLLRIYPISPTRLFLAKLCLGFLGMTLHALFVGLLVLAPQWSQIMDHLVSGRPVPLIFEEWQMWTLAAVSMLGWSIFFSLLTGRALPTLLIAPVALLMTFRSPYQPVLIGVLYVADWWLARRWLLDKPLPIPRMPILRRMRAVPRHVLFVSETASPRKVAFARLVWLEWQNAKPFVWLAIAVGLVAMAVGLFRLSGPSMRFNILLPYLAVLPGLMGAWSFAGEQHQRRFRVPTHRGLAPQSVWLSKQAVWLPLAFLICALLLSLDTCLHTWVRSVWPALRPGTPAWVLAAAGIGTGDREYLYQTVAALLLWIGLAYAGGQFLSMNLSRAITAAVITLPMMGLCILWWMLMQAGGIPIVWAVLPIPFVLLGATLLQSPDWLLERTGWKRWLKLASIVGVPMLIVLAGVIMFRVTEIPKVVVPELSPPRPTAAELRGRRGSTVISGRMDSVSLFNPVQSQYFDPNLAETRNPALRDPLFNTLNQLLRVLSPPPRLFSTRRQAEEASRKTQNINEAISSRVLHLCDSLLQPLRRLLGAALVYVSSQRSDQFQAGLRLVEMHIQSDLAFEFVLSRIKSADESGRPITLDDYRKLQELFDKRKHQAEEEAQAGQLDEALSHHLAMFQMCRQVAQVGGMDAWLRAVELEEQSFESLQKWLVHPRQTSFRIRIAMIRIQEELAQWPPLENWVVKQHARQRADFETDWSLSAGELRKKYGQKDANYAAAILWMRRCYPWEMARILRLYDATALADWNDVVEFRTFLSDGRMDMGAWLFDRAHGETRARLRKIEGSSIMTTDELHRLLATVDPKPWSWSATTMNPYGGWNSPLILYDRHLGQLQDFGTHEARRRGWMIVMALVGWRLEHGRLPQRLDELAPSYFTAVPSDPWTGRHFGYRPEGFPLPAEFGASRVEPDTPVIWSTGPEGSDPIRSLGGPNREAEELIFTLGPRRYTYRAPGRNRTLDMKVQRAHVIPN